MDIRKDTPSESDRLAALYRYHVLDTPPEKEFDQITRIAMISLQMPIALITFVDKDRQWFKSTQGTDVRQSPIDVSFCAQAIKKHGPTVIEDLQKDYHFSRNPFVIDGPRVRFYAGVPLTTPDGFNLGTVCVLDRQPRKLTLDQMLVLSDLAGLTMDKLELKRLKKPPAQ